MDETNVTTEESGKTTKKRAVPADQDLKVTNDINEAKAFLSVIDADPELAATLGTRGIDSAERAIGNGLVTAANNAYIARQSALGAETSAFAQVMVAEEPVLKNYADFRVLCRSRISDRGVQQALGLTGKVPTDRNSRLQVIRAAYTEAQKPMHQALMTKLGYTHEELTRLLAEVATLEAAADTARIAMGDALMATQERNKAMKALRAWMKSARATAKRVLANRPDLATKLSM